MLAGWRSGVMLGASEQCRYQHGGGVSLACAEREGSGWAALQWLRAQSLFLPQTHNLNLITRKHQTNLNGETFHRINVNDMNIKGSLRNYPRQRSKRDN